MPLSAGTYRGRLGDRLYTTEMPRAGEVVGLRGLGYPHTQYPYQTLTLGGMAETAASMQEFYAKPAVKTLVGVGRIAGTMLGAYHGVKRNNGKVWPGIGWGLLGGVFWPVVIPVIFAQGVGKR